MTNYPDHIELNYIQINRASIVKYTVRRSYYVVLLVQAHHVFNQKLRPT